MQQITYAQAAEILDRPYDSVKQAVNRGSLTRCNKRDKLAYLIKEQVVLFKGKGRISPRALSAQELDVWEQAKRFAEAVGSNTHADTHETTDTTNLKSLLQEIKDSLLYRTQSRETLERHDTPNNQLHAAFFTAVDRLKAGDRNTLKSFISTLDELAERSDLVAVGIKLWMLKEQFTPQQYKALLDTLDT